MELPSPKPLNYSRLQNTGSSVLTLSLAYQLPDLSVEHPGQSSYRSRPSSHVTTTVGQYYYTSTSHLKLLSLPSWCKSLCQEVSRDIINKTLSGKGAVINAPRLVEGKARLRNSISLAVRLFPQQNPCNRMTILSILLKVRLFCSLQTFFKEHHKI